MANLLKLIHQESAVHLIEPNLPHVIQNFKVTPQIQNHANLGQSRVLDQVTAVSLFLTHAHTILVLEPSLPKESPASLFLQTVNFCTDLLSPTLN